MNLLSVPLKLWAAATSASPDDEEGGGAGLWLPLHYWIEPPLKPPPWVVYIIYLLLRSSDNVLAFALLTCPGGVGEGKPRQSQTASFSMTQSNGLRNLAVFVFAFATQVSICRKIR